jgi:hypothetical protein
MQVIPKYAAAPLINVKDVRTADKNIEAGVKMLRHITDTYFNDPGINQVDKTLFTFCQLQRRSESYCAIAQEGGERWARSEQVVRQCGA